jgi:hypothetical protein
MEFLTFIAPVLLFVIKIFGVCFLFCVFVETLFFNLENEIDADINN